MSRHDETAGLDVLAVGAHPDDVELGCGGTLALLAQAGRRVGIVHLTRGEAGTRGTVEERRQEAQEAGRRLGAESVVLLDCGDGNLSTGTAEVDSLIGVIRRLRPDLVLGPPPGDRHPDHGRAHRLVVDATFYAGLAGRKIADGDGDGDGDALHAPHRPRALFAYMQHDSFDPAFVVDVTDVWDTKQHALDAYRSQLHQPGRESPGKGESGDGDDGPVTKVSHPDFRQAVTGRARHFGQLVGATFGEPFWSPGPLAVADPLSLLPKGLP
jgi:bacillithiol biosynthesis deacetylase BshB1